MKAKELIKILEKKIKENDENLEVGVSINDEHHSDLNIEEVKLIKCKVSGDYIALKLESESYE